MHQNKIKTRLSIDRTLNIKIVLVIFGLAIINAGVADISVKNTLPPNALTCPDTQTLTQDPKNKTWSAKGGWKSFNLSFATKADHFIGAQWVGVNVGKITCVYAPLEKMTFPITVQYMGLVFVPESGMWQKPQKKDQGYRNCISTKQNNCFFIPRLEPKLGPIYEEAKKLYQPKTSEPAF